MQTSTEYELRHSNTVWIFSWRSLVNYRPYFISSLNKTTQNETRQKWTKKRTTIQKQDTQNHQAGYRVTGINRSKKNIELNHKHEAHLETGILKTRRAPMRIFQYISIFVVSYAI